MNVHSILFKIILFFLLAFIAMTLLFKVIYESEFATATDKMKVHYHHVAMSIMRWRFGGGTQSELLESLASQQIEVVSDKGLYEKFDKQKHMEMVSCAKGDFRIYDQEGTRFVMAPKSVGQMLLKDLESDPINVNYVWWLYAIFVLIFLALFISIALSVYPIKGFLNKVRRFGIDKLENNFSIEGKDEIAQLSHAFENASKRIQGLIQARAIFLRNITHEIKTPITKGKISLELLEASRTKEILDNVFTRLDLLTKEFLQIEQVTACDHDITKKSYPLYEVMINALDLMFLEEDSIKHNISNQALEVDFDLFSIVFKNLIDNGIKYSDDHTVEVVCTEGEIAFLSRSKPLEFDLEYYLEPFTKCDIDPQNSFGLGLYLVDYIVKKHDFRFDYRHEAGVNHFVIIT